MSLGERYPPGDAVTPVGNPGATTLVFEFLGCLASQPARVKRCGFRGGFVGPHTPAGLRHSPGLGHPTGPPRRLVLPVRCDRVERGPHITNEAEAGGPVSYTHLRA